MPNQNIISEIRSEIINKNTEYYISQYQKALNFNYKPYTEINFSSDKSTYTINIHYTDCLYNNCISSVTEHTPRLSNLNPSKGLLLFLAAVYKYPNLKSRSAYCIICGQKPTSFQTTWDQLQYQYFITKTDNKYYTITDLGKKLLAAYNLI